MADRRLGHGPYVASPGGGTQPRARTLGGRWRAKRTDAGRTRKTKRK